MKVIDLLNAQPIMQEVVNRKLPAKLAYGFAKNFRLINSELEDYNKSRIKILSENWKLNKETGKYDIPDEDQEKWRELHDEILNIDCGFEPFKIDMKLIENLEWSPNEILSLWFLFSGEGVEDIQPKVK